MNTYICIYICVRACMYACMHVCTKSDRSPAPPASMPARPPASLARPPACPAHPPGPPMVHGQSYGSPSSRAVAQAMDALAGRPACSEARKSKKSRLWRLKVEKKSTLRLESRKKVDFALIGPGPRPWTSGWAGWIRISTDLLPNSSLLDSSLNRPRPEVELQSHEKSMVAAKLTMRDQ